jgi:hypothetical protein
LRTPLEPAGSCQHDEVPEHGTYLDGIDGVQAPALREEGTAEMLDGIARYLTAQPASRLGTDDLRPRRRVER